MQSPPVFSFVTLGWVPSIPLATSQWLPSSGIPLPISIPPSATLLPAPSSPLLVQRSSDGSSGQPSEHTHLQARPSRFMYLFHSWWFQGLTFTGLWVIGHEVSSPPPFSPPVAQA